MIVLPIISIICCVAYIIFILYKYGVPVSISETYYLLPSKLDWLFATWSILTAVPFGIYWFTVAPDKLKWIPVTVMIALLLVGAACCYKSGPKSIKDYKPNIVKGNISLKENEKVVKTSSIKDFIKYIINKFKPSNFFKYGLARFIHYINSLIAIILTTIYFCMTCGSQAIAGTIISYVVWILIGGKVDGVYNVDYSIDLDNSARIFFGEIVCLINLFIFIW